MTEIKKDCDDVHQLVKKMANNAYKRGMDKAITILEDEIDNCGLPDREKAAAHSALSRIRRARKLL
jgi:hypothetical protein